MTWVLFQLFRLCWSLFWQLRPAGQLSRLSPEGEGLNTYISAIPYMLYPWVAVLLVLTAPASGCTPCQHAIIQIPYALIAAMISIVGYLAIAYL